MAILHVEFRTPDCKEEEAFIFKFPADADKPTIMEAIEVLYPDNFSVLMEIQDDDG